MTSRITIHIVCRIKHFAPRFAQRYMQQMAQKCDNFALYDTELVHKMLRGKTPNYEPALALLRVPVLSLSRLQPCHSILSFTARNWMSYFIQLDVKCFYCYTA